MPKNEALILEFENQNWRDPLGLDEARLVDDVIDWISGDRETFWWIVVFTLNDYHCVFDGVFAVQAQNKEDAIENAKKDYKIKNGYTTDATVETIFKCESKPIEA